MIISTLTGKLASPAQLERVFGPNTIFAINPWHPRHVASLAAVILGIPSLIQSTLNGAFWIYRKVSHSENYESSNDPKRLMILFNTITSRPLLHLGNQLGQLIRN